MLAVLNPKPEALPVVPRPRLSNRPLAFRQTAPPLPEVFGIYVTYFGPKALKYINRDYCQAKVYTTWAHGPLKKPRASKTP